MIAESLRNLILEDSVVWSQALAITWLDQVKTDKWNNIFNQILATDADQRAQRIATKGHFKRNRFNAGRKP
jgi:hypothetical protein